MVRSPILFSQGSRTEIDAGTEEQTQEPVASQETELAEHDMDVDIAPVVAPTNAQSQKPAAEINANPGASTSTSKGKQVAARASAATVKAENAQIRSNLSATQLACETRSSALWKEIGRLEKELQDLHAQFREKAQAKENADSEVVQHVLERVGDASKDLSDLRTLVNGLVVRVRKLEAGDDYVESDDEVIVTVSHLSNLRPWMVR